MTLPLSTQRPVTVVTSCSKQGWKEYGERCVKSFHQFWYPDIDLYIVSEDALPFEPDSVKGRNIRVLPLGMSRAAAEFLARHEHNLWVHGNGSVPRPDGIAPKWRARNDNVCYFRYDAYKFCKKVFAIELVAEAVAAAGGGRLVWLDADTITFAPVPFALAETLHPPQYALACLDRPGYHSECGYVSYSLDHRQGMSFIRKFAGIYASDEVFKLPEWHDSWVFDWVRKHHQIPTYSIPHKSMGHPFINSDLGIYMDHLKGRRKERGRSAPQEQVRNVKVAYWGRK